MLSVSFVQLLLAVPLSSSLRLQQLHTSPSFFVLPQHAWPPVPISVFLLQLVVLDVPLSSFLLLSQRHTSLFSVVQLLLAVPPSSSLQLEQLHTSPSSFLQPQ